MLFYIFALVFLTVLFLMKSCELFLNKKHYLTRERLENLKQPVEKIHSAEYDEMEKPLKERIFKPFIHSISGIFGKHLPQKRRESLKLQLQRAGNPGGWDAGEYFTLKLALTVSLVTFTLIISYLIVNTFTWKILFLGACVLLVGWYGPDLALRKKIEARRVSIKRSLPDVLDLMSVSMEAGLGFDAAMSKVVEKYKGPLAEEFARTLREIRMGKKRREALKDMGIRNGVDELYSFVNAVIQADQLGMGMVNIMCQQSDVLRLKKRQAAEEAAMKAPVKMLLPLIFFIFPSIFIILLGPALLQIMEVFKK